jgi:spermidine synthase
MLLFLVGLLAILSQVVLLRELNVAFYGVELVYALGLSAWMAGGAAGALVASRRLAATRGRLTWLLAIAAVALPADVALIRGSRLLLGGIPGAFLPFDRQVIALAGSILPLSFALGLAFRWAAGLAARAGRTLAHSYAVECGGAASGATAATIAFACGLQTLPAAILAAGLVPAVLIAGSARARTSAARATALAAATLAATVGAAAFAPRLDLRMTAWSHPAVVETRDSPYARVTATVTGSQTALFVDDVLVFESEGAGPEELAHLTALQHPAPRRMLLLGGTVEGVADQLRRHAPERLDAVELDATCVRVAARWLGRRPDAVVEDPRAFLGREARYDVIVVAMPQPTSGQSNRFYTREFFAECRRRLEPGGVMGFRLDVPENVITPLMAVRTASVVEAARAAFPFVEVLPGTSAVVLASGAPLPPGADVLSARWHARGLAARLVTPAYLHYLYENDRRVELDRRLRAVGAPANSDDRPVCYEFAALGWLARFYPDILRVDAARLAAARPGWQGALAAGVGLVGLFLVARRWQGSRTALLAGVAGVAGMLLETVVLLEYQARSGALFERLGALLTAFMAGMAAGAWLADRWLAAPGRRPRGQAATVFALACLGAVIGVLAGRPSGIGFGGSALLLCAAGALVSAIFAGASAVAGPADADRIGSLYGADLAGGAAGSLLAGLVIVPLAGLAPTAWVVAALGVLALLLA